jgi:hypothetical protein
MRLLNDVGIAVKVVNSRVHYGNRKTLAFICTSIISHLSIH